MAFSPDPVARETRDFSEWADLFRFLAASLVVFGHARDLLLTDYAGEKPWLPVYALGGFLHSGVVLFFVLSGYWVGRAVLRRIDSPHFWRDYAIDRLSRLLVFLVPALLLGGLCDWLGFVRLGLPVYSGALGAHSIGTDLADHLTPATFVGNIAFLQMIAVPVWGSNGPLWSLSYEFWYYVWFPALVLLLVRRRPTLALGGLVVGLVNPEIAVGFLSWLVGIVLYRWMWRGPAPSAAPRGRPGKATMLALLALLAMLGLVRHVTSVATDLPLAAVFALLLAALVHDGVRFPRVLKAAAAYGRRASFSLYVVHFPTITLVAGLILGTRHRFAPAPASVGLVLLFTLGAIALGWLFSLATEANTPAVRDILRRRFVAPARSPLSATVDSGHG